MENLSSKEKMVVQAMRNAEGLEGDKYITVSLHQTTLKDALKLTDIQDGFGGYIQREIRASDKVQWITIQVDNIEITAFLKREDEVEI